LITSIWRGGGYEGLAYSIGYKSGQSITLHVYYLFSLYVIFCFVFYHFLVFLGAAIDHSLVVVVFVQAQTMCSRRE
jgi:hypothetical protein